MRPRITAPQPEQTSAALAAAQGQYARTLRLPGAAPTRGSIRFRVPIHGRERENFVAIRYFSTHSATEPSRATTSIFTQRPLASYQTSRGRLASSR